MVAKLYVCALNGKGINKINSEEQFPSQNFSLPEIIRRVQVPDARGRARSIASRKGVCREAWSEVSETAKVGTDEQEPNRRLHRSGEIAHQIDAQG